MKIKKENLIKGIIFAIVMWLCIGAILILLDDVIWYGNLIGKFNYKFREILAFSSAAICGLIIGITGAKIIMGDWTLKIGAK